MVYTSSYLENGHQPFILHYRKKLQRDITFEVIDEHIIARLFIKHFKTEYG